MRGLSLVFVLVLTALLFAPTLGYPFVSLDDEYFVLHNPGIQELSWETVLFLFLEDQHDFRYYPLAYLSWALDLHLFGPDPLYFHGVNLLFHLANVLLVFLFVEKLCGRLPVAMLTSLLFAIHPLQVESVSWVMQRRNVLFFFFFLLAMLSYHGSLRAGEAHRLRKGAALLATHLLFLLSVLSKTAGVTLPAVLLLIDFHREAPARGELAAFLRRRLPPKLLFLPVILFAYLMTRRAAARSPFVTDYAYAWWEWLVLLGHNLFFYPFKALLPTRLGVFYATPEPGALPPHFLLFALGSLLLLSWMAWGWSRQREVFWGVAFYVVTISPMVILTLFFSDMPLLAADRFFYQSAPGLFFAAAVGVDAVWRRGGRVLVPALALGLVLVLLSLFAHSVRQRETWRSSTALYEALLAHHPSDEFFYRLAFEYERAGDDPRAFRALEEAERARHQIFFTRLFDHQFRIYSLYLRKGDLGRAAAFLEGALESTPNPIDAEDARSRLAYLYLADLHERGGAPDRAARLRSRAESPGLQPMGLFEIAWLAHTPDAARSFLEGHLEQHPEDGAAWWQLGACYADQGDAPRAEAARRRAASLGFRP